MTRTDASRARARRNKAARTARAEYIAKWASEPAPDWHDPEHQPTDHDPQPVIVIDNYEDQRSPVDFAVVGRNRLLPGDSGERKTYPLGTGLLDYFPDALAAVAKVSYDGNEKHNPGQPLHWARGKSMDHEDCIIRHFVERGGRDAQGNRHSAQLAWRALALLQQEIEAELGLNPPRGTQLPQR